MTIATMVFEWLVIPSDGTDFAPVEIRSLEFGRKDEPGVHIKGEAMIAEVEPDMQAYCGGRWYFEVDALALEGDQDLELHIPPTYVDTLDEAEGAVAQALFAHNEAQARTIIPG